MSKPWNACECGEVLESDSCDDLFADGDHVQCRNCDRWWWINITCSISPAPTPPEPYADDMNEATTA